MKSTKKSAGIVLFRRTPELQILLVHPGGPFWVKKDDGAWSIPKGEFTDESPLEAAVREVREELGLLVKGEFIELAPIRQAGGKWVYAWAHEGDCDVTQIKSNTFSMEWPPRFGKMKEFPEIDRAEWFSLGAARKKILTGQSPLLDQLIQILAGSPEG